MVVFWGRICLVCVPVPRSNPWFYTTYGTVVHCGRDTGLSDWFFNASVRMVVHINALLRITDFAPFSRMDVDCWDDFDGSCHHDQFEHLTGDY